MCVCVCVRARACVCVEAIDYRIIFEVLMCTLLILCSPLSVRYGAIEMTAVTSSSGSSSSNVCSGNGRVCLSVCVRACVCVCVWRVCGLARACQLLYCRSVSVPVAGSVTVLSTDHWAG